MSAALAMEMAQEAAGFMLGRLTCVPDLSGALYLPDERTLLVADLHLEKGSAFAARGQFLPPYDTKTTLAALASVIARLDPRRVIALGDSFHDRRAGERLQACDLASITAMAQGRDWLWLTGNHDRELPAGLPGEVAADHAIDGVTLVHEPGETHRAEIAGHLHPAARVHLRGRSVRGRAFVTCGTRLVMPAFGAFTGGLNVRDAAFRGIFPGAMTAHVIGRSRVFAVGRSMLLPD